MSKSIHDYTPIEQLAIKQALFKVLAEDVDTKDPDNLRGYVSADILDRYEQTGAKSYDVRVDGRKVGTMGVTLTKATEDRTERRFAVLDGDALGRWFPTGDASRLVDEWLAAHWREFARWYFERTGELPDGCDVIEETVPGQPERVKGTSLRIDPKRVASALGANLPTAVAGLLGGGE